MSLLPHSSAASNKYLGPVAVCLYRDLVSRGGGGGELVEAFEKISASEEVAMSVFRCMLINVHWCCFSHVVVHNKTPRVLTMQLNSCSVHKLKKYFFFFLEALSQSVKFYFLKKISL